MPRGRRLYSDFSSIYPELLELAMKQGVAEHQLPTMSSAVSMVRDFNVFRRSLLTLPDGGSAEFIERFMDLAKIAPNVLVRTERRDGAFFLHVERIETDPQWLRDKWNRESAEVMRAFEEQSSKAEVAASKIDTSDIPEVGEDWFKHTKLRLPGQS